MECRRRRNGGGMLMYENGDVIGEVTELVSTDFPLFALIFSQPQAATFLRLVRNLLVISSLRQKTSLLVWFVEIGF